MKNASHDIFGESTALECLSIPKALMEFQSKMLYNSYMVLEIQLSQIDNEVDPILYENLNTLTQSAFDSWVALGFREGGK